MTAVTVRVLADAGPTAACRRSGVSRVRTPSDASALETACASAAPAAAPDDSSGAGEAPRSRPRDSRGARESARLDSSSAR